MDLGNVPSGSSVDRQIPMALSAAPGAQNVLGSPARAVRKPKGFSSRWQRAFQVLGVGIAVAAVVMAGLLTLFWMRSQGAVEVVQAQVEAIRVGNVEQAYALFSSEYQAGVSLPMFRRWLRQGRFGKVRKLQFWGRSVWGKTALLWGSFQDDLGHTYRVRYLLIREKGSWRIDGFHFSEQTRDSFSGTTRFIPI